MRYPGGPEFWVIVGKVLDILIELLRWLSTGF